jgi:hypothetical protein
MKALRHYSGPKAITAFVLAIVPVDVVAAVCWQLTNPNNATTTARTTRVMDKPYARRWSGPGTERLRLPRPPRGSRFGPPRSTPDPEQG